MTGVVAPPPRDSWIFLIHSDAELFEHRRRLYEQIGSGRHVRQALRRIMDVAGDCVIDINITDVETTYGNPSVLTTWAQIAQEVTESYA